MSPSWVYLNGCTEHCWLDVCWCVSSYCYSRFLRWTYWFKRDAGSMRFAFGVQNRLEVKDILKAFSRIIAQEFTPWSWGGRHRLTHGDLQQTIDITQQTLGETTKVNLSDTVAVRCVTKAKEWPEASLQRCRLDNQNSESDQQRQRQQAEAQSQEMETLMGEASKLLSEKIDQTAWLKLKILALNRLWFEFARRVHSHQGSAFLQP